MSISENIACIVVVYNKNCKDSLTCKSLENAKGVKVVILDNSTKEYGNETYCRKSDWVYINNNGNIGLSRAYNKGIEYLQSENFKGYMCLFDDDSEFDANYFDCIAKWKDHDCAADKKHIILPVVYSGETIISPCKIDENMRTSVFTSVDEAMGYSGCDITGINSAMAIQFSVFDNYRYDENIFLDGIDHKFMSDMKKSGCTVSVIDYVMKQNFSGNEKPSMDAALNRFAIYAKDMKYIMAQNMAGYKKLLIRRLLRLTVTYKSLSFIKKYAEIMNNK